MAITVDGTGVQAPSLPEAEADVRDDLTGIFGADIATSTQTPQGQIGGVLAVEKTEAGEAIVGVSNAMSIHRAVGPQLDAIGSMLDIRRREGTRSRVTATLRGQAGVNVPVRSRAATAAGDEFRTLTAVTLTAAGVEVELEAVEIGPAAIAAGALTQIVTLVPGWESITNASAGAVGSLRENDVLYRARLIASTARGAVGSFSAMQGALLDALVGKHEIYENETNATATVQQFIIHASAILVVASDGSAADIRRAVETHRTMGVGTMTAIVGGTADESALAAISNGTVTWNGTDYTGLDLTATTTAAERAAALTALLANTGVTVAAIDGAYVAMFAWLPGQNPQFGTGTTEEAFGLRSDDATYPEGPFIRPRNRPLTVTMDITRGSGFPSDGLQQIRDRVFIVVSLYDVGQQVWLNDILRVAEGVPGTRVTSISVQHNGVDVSGQNPPLDAVWTLPNANLTVNIA